MLSVLLLAFLTTLAFRAVPSIALNAAPVALATLLSMLNAQHAPTYPPKPVAVSAKATSSKTLSVSLVTSSLIFLIAPNAPQPNTYS